MPTHSPSDSPSYEPVSSGDEDMDHWAARYIWPDHRDGFLQWLQDKNLDDYPGDEYGSSEWTAFAAYIAEKDRQTK